MKWYKLALRHYAVFHGTTGRKPYWSAIGFNFLFGFVALVLDVCFGLSFHFGGVNIGYGYAFILYNACTLVPMIAITVRRIHDAGKSSRWIGKWLLAVSGLLSAELAAIYADGFFRFGEAIVYFYFIDAFVVAGLCFWFLFLLTLKGADQ